MPYLYVKKLALYVSVLGALCGASPASAAQSLYGAWPNGPPQDPNFFPIAVWYQNPTSTGNFGAYTSLAAAVAGERINIFLGLSGTTGGSVSWPENYGSDNGELEAIKAHNLYVIGGLATPYTQDTSAQSVASMLALAQSIGASSNLIGYNEGDEPDCTAALAEPAQVAALGSFDPTRIVTYNHNHWMTQPAYDSCLATSITALQSASIASADFYPLTNTYVGGGSPVFAKSDFLSVPNDTLFMQGIMTEGLLHYSLPGQPVWPFVESGGDNFGFSEATNYTTASVSQGSKMLTLTSHWTRFTRTWLGLTVSGAGIPANTKVTSILDGAHLGMSKAATASRANETVTIRGGVNNSDCVASVNLCVAQGNEYRPTPAQVNSEVWISLISGANGIEYFCHDKTSYSFCLAGGGRAAAIQAQNNLTYINTNVLNYAPILNSPTVGQCSMQHQNYTTDYGWSTTASCTGGILTMATTNAAIPGLGLVKSYNGATYLFAESDRRSLYGAYYHFTLAGLANKTATVVYDSNAQYDPANSSLGQKLYLSSVGYFADVLGANHDDYQVKIYAIQ
jgi:hypothetical protein